MCNIGEPIRTVVIDPIQVPAPVPDRPQFDPEPFTVPEPLPVEEPVLVPIRG